MKNLNPISASKVAAGKVSLSEINVVDGKVYWLESRPQDKGRRTLKCFSDGNENDLLPKEFSVNSKVHEYGGGVYKVVGEQIYFVNAKDQCIFHFSIGQEPKALTAKSKKRFADFEYSEAWDCLIAVCEDHDPIEPEIEGEPENTLVAIDCKSGHLEPLIKGAAFYSAPRISPDGKKLCWIDWNHPNMPWDHTRLWVADIEEKYELANPVQIAGQTPEAVVQPEWWGDELRFVTDRTGWWNLYQTPVAPDSARLLFEEEKEFARAPWVFALTNFVNMANGNIFGFTEAEGRHRLYLLDTKSNTKTDILSKFNTVESIATIENKVFFIAGTKKTNQSVWQYDTDSEELTSISKLSAELSEYAITTAKSIQFPTTHDQIAHANLYLPEVSTSQPAKLPPLLVKCHGGPSGVALKGLDWKIQYLTSRGFAVLDVNYRGSTGFGRDYRHSLYGHWGEHDVDDCLAGIDYLVERNLVDSNKIVITGGSAGGYTVLRALIVSDVFAAGTSYYGVADLSTLVGDDHKFESRYLETCIAPYATHPERYEELSPINHVEQITAPMLFLQGLKDMVVQPNQTTGIVEKLKQKGNQVEMIEFPEEGHGFRQAESIITSLESEYGFYMNVFR